MADSTLEPPAAPSVPYRSRPVLRVEPRPTLLSLRVHELWGHRELLYFLIWRDTKVRYRQAALGALWVLLQPLISMAVLTFVFTRFAMISTNGVPYPLFALAALLPWQYLSTAVSRSGISIVSSANMVSKIYFPRLLVPLAAVAAPLLDLAIALVLLLAMMAFYRVWPGWSVLGLPLVVLLAVAAALGASLWLSALHVRYRDVSHLIPFLVQTWIFVSPIAYPASIVPEKWRLIYGLNPVVSVVEGFRWCMLGSPPPGPLLLLPSVAVIILVLLTGIAYFHRTEDTFADVI
jgi:lipopolysaccharide transport system permease protein